MSRLHDPFGLATPVARVADGARRAVVAGRVLTRAGVIRPYLPSTLVKVGWEVRSWGLGFAGGFTAAGTRIPDRIGLIDERGELTFAEIDRRTNALADQLARRGVAAGDAVGLLARNHRGFVDAIVAISKLGAHTLLLNTAFAAPQIAEVCDRERPVLLIHDEEFEPLVNQAGVEAPRIWSWTDDVSDPPARIDSTDRLIKVGATTRRRPPDREGRIIILTSGTTGTPKGAPRGGGNLSAAVALLERIPLRTGWRSYVAAPLFHTWGFAHLNLAMLLGTTVVLSRRFAPEECLQLVTDHRCDSMIMIPVMLQRILNLPPQTLARYDLSGVKAVVASGSALPGDLAHQWMDRFGDHLFNVYGSTEVAWASVATPADLRAAPGTAGKPPINTEVRILDDDGLEVPPGTVGRIFVGNSMLFDGYSGGGHKEQVGGLMSSGDVGHFDETGRLFVEGRDDEMIVSGGENVFPQEVEDCLARHAAVIEAAAIGVPDDEFGQRLAAYVVRRPGAGVDADDLRAHVKRELARYKVPRDIVFVDELPRNATGKILKRELGREHR